MDQVFYGFAVLLFAACFLMVEGAWLWWAGTHGSSAQRIAKRLQVMSARGDGGPRVSILKQRRYSTSAGVEQLLRRMPSLLSIGRLDRQLLQSGLRWSVAQLLVSSLLMLLAGAVLVMCWSAPFLVSSLVVVLAPLLPCLFVLRTRSARIHKIEMQLPEAADFLARALRAGHSFSNVLQMVGDELPEPLSGEFRLTYDEVNYGAPMSEALQNLATRIPLTDLRYLIVAVLIQRESGGNLAEILNSISRIIRARLKLLAQVRVLSAEGKMSAWVLGLLPAVMLVVMWLLNPRYISLLWNDPIGIRLLWYSAGMLVFATLWMRSVIRIRV